MGKYLLTAIDATGLRAIRDFADAVRPSGRACSCATPVPAAALMAQTEFHRHVGAENILTNVDAALRRATELRAAA